MQKIVVILPMRSGSQRVINKNSRIINGKYLYSISVDEDFGATTGSTTFLDERFGTSPKKIAEFITNLHK